MNFLQSLIDNKELVGVILMMFYEKNFRGNNLDMEKTY